MLFRNARKKVIILWQTVSHSVKNAQEERAVSSHLFLNNQITTVHLFCCLVYIYIFIYIVLCVCVCVCARACACLVTLIVFSGFFATLWTVACQAPLFMEFSRQEYWSSHALLQGIFLTQGLNSISCVSCITGRFFTHRATWEAHTHVYIWLKMWMLLDIYHFKCLINHVHHQI